MFIQLKHKSLAVYAAVSEMVKEAYLITRKLPDSEKFNLISQIRRAALSVKLNLGEGCSRRSVRERNRFFEISRGSLIEVDTALETAVDLGFLQKPDLVIIGELLNKCFAMLTKMFI